MVGMHKTFKYEFRDSKMLISSADPRIGVLKVYDDIGMPTEDSDATVLGKGRIDLDFDELHELQEGKRSIDCV